jgi:hypothetical protein
MVEMTDKANRVFNAWVHLTADEQREVDDEIRKYKLANSTDQRHRRDLSERVIQKMETGPLSGVCPYCGR